MLQPVNVGTKSLADYARILGRGLMAEIERRAGPMEGKRVLHLSATAFGGGVAEINYALVPLMRSAGLEAEWRIIHGQEEVFNLTKKIPNACQGSPVGLTVEDEQIFHQYNASNAAELDDSDYDFIIIHDPQPAAVIDHFSDSRAAWIWRCHIDLSEPNQEVLGFLLPSLSRYDAAIFHRPEYVPDAEELPQACIWLPAT